MGQKNPIVCNFLIIPSPHCKALESRTFHRQSLLMCGVCPSSLFSIWGEDSAPHVMAPYRVISQNSCGEIHVV